MRFFARHRWGKSEASTNDGIVEVLVGELDAPGHDDEHVEVSVRLPSGWAVGCYPSGLVVIENVEDLDVPPRHLAGVSRGEAGRIMTLLVRGELDALEALPWRKGYGP